MKALEQLREELGDCTRCGLSETRDKIVFGTGSPVASWMICGEAPGEQEDLIGAPFLGKAGSLLTDLLTESGWTREQVFITNIVKCRPPLNRNPLTDEIASCRPFLFRQIEIIKPIIITTLGKLATNLLLGNKGPLYNLRGNVIDFMGAKVVPTYHPSYIQRGNWDKLKIVKDDFSLVNALLMEQGILPAK